MKFGKQFIAILSIFYLSALEMSLAFGTTFLLDYFFLDRMKEQSQTSSTPVLLAYAGFYMGMLMTIVYYGRTLLRLIPFPLDGIFGFKHSSMEEWTHFEAFLVFAVIYWDGLTLFVDELKKRIVLTSTHDPILFRV